MLPGAARGLSVSASAAVAGGTVPCLREAPEPRTYTLVKRLPTSSSPGAAFLAAADPRGSACSGRLLGAELLQYAPLEVVGEMHPGLPEKLDIRF